MAMMKKLWTLSLVFFLIVSRQTVAYSYDFREDAMNDAEREIAETMEGNILKPDLSARFFPVIGTKKC